MQHKKAVLWMVFGALACPAAGWSDQAALFETQLTEPGVYVAAFGGMSFQSDSNVNLDAPGGTLGTLKFDTGSLFGGAVGYQFENPFRIEAELAHRGYDVGRVKSAGTVVPAGGDVSILSLMVNAYHDLTYDQWKPYLGIGLGVADVAWNDVTSALTPPIDHSDYVFAVQLLAGVGYELTPLITATAGYRLFGTSDPKFTARNGTVVTGKIIASEFILGLRYRF
ncbi:outer membrane protein [Nitrospina gracilis]|uniref:outer membrane protein n=1 Tax=Nitrospina gracilis TaxID=35801 RepID=UPI001F1FB8FD|nr:outer membrane beta-barrel protein [Nitrospina gracilis]MCF8719367.1 opacity protein-like surface antigen [Nitrospina gracilis Nb-211]